MSEWRIEALWDRPSKYMAQASTHHLLLRITPGAPALSEAFKASGPGASAGVSRPVAAEGGSATGGAVGPDRPAIAVAIDTSRSMGEHESFAACAAALNSLLASYGSCCNLRLASFGKAVIPLDAARMAELLQTQRLRSVSRYDLALQWLADQGSAAGEAGLSPRLALLLGDGMATDEHGYDASPELLLAAAQRLTDSGARLLLALTKPQPELLGVLSQLDLVTVLHPSGLHQELTELLGEIVSNPTAPVEAETPARATDDSGLYLRLDSRLQGLQLRRVLRLRPHAGCLMSRGSGGNGWLVSVGKLAPWETLELLIELGLPLAQFGAVEGPGPTLAAALQDASGHELSAHDCQLDFTADPRRAQQLGSETDQARRNWELSALDSWPASQAEQRARRQTGKLPPLPGFASAPPVGGVPQ